MIAGIFLFNVVKVDQVAFKGGPRALHNEPRSPGCWPGFVPLAHLLFA